MPESWASYFGVLCSILDHAPYGRDTAQYSRMLWQLYNTEFKVSIPMDENRIADALEFRRTYSYGDLTQPVGMLEMMLSLANRIEVDIMHGTVEFDRTGDWFWAMIESLGLSDMTNDVYDETIVSDVLDRFMHRRYSRNGKRGLFTIHDSAIDMREQEIWYQASLYLTDVLKAEGFIEP